MLLVLLAVMHVETFLPVHKELTKTFVGKKKKVGPQSGLQHEGS